VPSRRGAGLAHLEGDSGWPNERLPCGLGRRLTQKHRLHHADESRGHAGDLPAVRLLGRGPAVQHPVCRAAPQ